MKIRILLILYLCISAFLLAKERMTHTFKTHNFRMELPTHWELKKYFGDHKQKPLLTPVSTEDRINLEVFVYAQTEETKDKKLGFIQTLKTLQLWAENYTDLDQEAEFAFYNLDGYWAKTMGYRQKKKINGYIVYGSDGVNLFVIHTYTYANLFPKNFLTMKDIFRGFSLNRNFKNECCNECTNLSQGQSKASNVNSADFTETEECLLYFQNKPQTVSQCK